MPNFYKQIYDQIGVLNQRPELDASDTYERALRNLWVTKPFLQGYQYDQFGYPIVRDFEVPLIPDMFLRQISDNIDYREGLQEWQLIFDNPEVKIDLVRLPREFDDISSEGESRFYQIAGEKLRGMVDKNIKSLKKLDDPMALQVRLNMYRNIARTQAVSEFKSKEYNKYKVK